MATTPIGQLGDGTFLRRAEPGEVVDLSGVSAVGSGPYRLLAVATNGFAVGEIEVVTELL